MRLFGNIGLLTIALAMPTLACKEKEKDKDEKVTAAQRPGELLLTLDKAMGSIAFTGQASTTLAEWHDTHCKNEGSGVKDEFQNDPATVWGCKLVTVTDGPDTPRGGMQRVKSIACMVDKALDGGTLAFDEKAHEFKSEIDDVCWGASFAAKAKEQMSDKIGPNGWVEVNLKVTGYNTVPADMGDSSKWNKAVVVDFGEEIGEKKIYTMLFNFSDEMLAAQILDRKDEDSEADALAISIKFLGGEEDRAEFRYEGRFPFSKFGDTTIGSRHLRLKVGGPYAGEGGFKSVDKGEGFEAGSWGDTLDAADHGRLEVFGVTAEGIAAQFINVNADGSVSGTPGTIDWSGSAGTTAPTLMTYEATEAQIGAFMAKSMGTYTGNEEWFKAKAPLDFESVVIDGK